MRPHRLAVAAGWLLFVCHLGAQGWVDHREYGWRLAQVQAYDTVREVIVSFGGTDLQQHNDLWEWRDDRWLPRPEPGGPQDVLPEGAVYDSQRRRTVFLMRGTASMSTWEWDGVRWYSNTGAQPTVRVQVGMAFDRARRRTVMFGGGWLGQDETWEYDGISWTRMQPASAPPPRSSAAMGYDPIRARTILFGGVDQALLADTWEWDGTTWTQVVAAGPSARMGAGLCWDANAGRMLLYGGYPRGLQLTDTWWFDGTAWTQATLLPGPAVVTALLATNTDVICPTSTRNRWEMWRWNGTTWTRQAQQAQPGLAPRIAAMAPGSNRVLQWGGASYDAATGVVAFLDEAWEWTGFSWIPSTASGGPSPRTGHAMALQLHNQQVVLFGGQTATGVVGDTWHWDGMQWTPFLATGPGPRQGHSMAYDIVRQRVLLTGGDPASDTWEWDGALWTPVLTGSAPSARVRATMAYDPIASRVMLHGGLDSNTTVLEDTWTFDGIAWTLQAMLPEVFAGALAFDPVRGRMVLLEAAGQGAYEWNAGWQATATPTGDFVQGALANLATNRMVVLTGVAGIRESSPGPLPSVGRMGTPCVGSGPVPRLTAVGQPVLGGTVDLDVDLGVSRPVLLVLASRAGNVPFGSCTLVPAIGEVVWFGVGASGFESWRLQVPTTLGLLGLRVYGQALTTDAQAASGLGVAASDGVVLTIGR